MYVLLPISFFFPTTDIIHFDRYIFLWIRRHHNRYGSLVYTSYNIIMSIGI